MFVCDREQLGRDLVTLAGPEGRHATTVRRIAPGERVDLTDGSGLLAECEVVAARPRVGELDLAVLARRTDPEPRCALTVVQAIVKGSAGELAAELMTEVGVDTIVPWDAERSVARWRHGREENSLGRWRTAAREAAKQSRRSRFPVVTAQARTADVIELVRRAELAAVLDPVGEAALATLALPSDGEIVVVVGPEGGISPPERASLMAAGAVSARIGPTILRGATAGAVAATLVLSRCGRWA